MQTHSEAIKGKHLRELFTADPGCGQRFTADNDGNIPRLLKEPRNRGDPELLIALAEESGLRAKIEVMFRGDKIGNITENRAVLHVALRAPKDEQIVVDGGEDVVPASLCCAR